MLEVEVENFQSIEKASFQIEGFTALVGRSNIGKSAAVRALKCALTGAPGTDFVRHGPQCERRLKGNKKCRCQATVRLKMPEVTYVWEKGDSINRYTVLRPGQEPEEFDKPGVGTPDFLKPDFDPVKIGDTPELVQVSDQFAPIFLLNQSGPAVADVLSDVARLDDINAAMRLVGKDRKSAAATRKVREADVLQLRTDLEAYTGLDGLVTRGEEIEQKFEAIGKAKDRLSTAEKLLAELSGLVTLFKALEEVLRSKVPDLGLLQEHAKKTDNLTRLYDAVVQRVSVVRDLAGVDKVVIPDVQPLQDALENVERVEEWITKAQALRDTMVAAKTFGEAAISETQPLKAALEKWAEVEELATRFEALETALSGADQLDVELPEASALRDAFSKWEAAERFFGRFEAVSQEEADLSESLQDLADEFEKVLQEFEDLGVCPTCTQEIGPGHSIHREAS